MSSLRGHPFGLRARIVGVVLVTAVATLAVSHADAVMAPHYERIRELHMLIDDADLQAKLAGRPIDKIEVLSIAHLLADAIDAVFEDTSVSDLFGEKTRPSAQ